MRFKDIIGHSEVKQRLVRTVEDGRISHAQLFVGDEGAGALALAMAYAQYVNCQSPEGGDSCGQCSSCRQMEELAHPDVHFIFPVNKSKSAQAVSGLDGDKPVSDHYIKSWRDFVRGSVPRGYFTEQDWYKFIDIDNKQGAISRHEASQIIRKLSFKAFESPYKVLIMWLPERMNDQSANALLKILEEPWDKTLFLLVSESPEKLLDTIISRTQEIRVPAIDTESMAGWLQGHYSLDSTTAVKLARLSFGDILAACRFAEDSGKEDEYFEMFVSLMRLSYNDKHLQLMEWADTAAGMGRESQKTLLYNVLRLLRESYMLSMKADNVSYLYGAEYDFCSKFSPFVNNRNVEALAGETELAIKHISQNGNARIIFTHYVLTVSKLISRL